MGNSTIKFPTLLQKMKARYQSNARIESMLGDSHEQGDF